MRFQHIFRPILKICYLSKPKLLNILESILHSHVVCHKNTMCSFIISTCNCSKSLLSSSIPYLQFYNIFSKFDRSSLIMIVLESKINTNCCEITLLKSIIWKSPKNRWFSNWTCTDYDNFKQVIVFFNHRQKCVLDLLSILYYKSN
jgi:hypothetical protein